MKSILFFACLLSFVGVKAQNFEVLVEKELGFEKLNSLPITDAKSGDRKAKSIDGQVYSWYWSVSDESLKKALLDSCARCAEYSFSENSQDKIDLFLVYIKSQERWNLSVKFSRNNGRLYIQEQDILDLSGIPKPSLW